MPVFGSLLAAQLLDERLHLYHALGIAMIFAGIMLAWVLGRGTRVAAPRIEQPDLASGTCREDW
jgi:drug/metabolite transporter (DMT)-like permease